MHVEIRFACEECNEQLSVSLDTITGTILVPTCKTCEEDVKQESYEEGVSDGREEGYDDGYREGYDDGVGDEYYQVMREVREVLSRFLTLPPELHAAIEKIGK